jgi:serine/threonine protein kinase
VLGLLGRGGMAEVMLARRADGAWEGEAAIKVLRRGMDSAAILARFALEQRALGRLSHPHIARLLDAGRTAQGQPYFVMERVQGLPIDRACAGRSLAQRLACSCSWPMRWPSPTASCWCTATSNPAMCWSRPRARSSCWTSALPRRWSPARPTPA